MDIVEIAHRTGRIADLMADYLQRSAGCDDALDAARVELRQHAEDLLAVQPLPLPPPSPPAEPVTDAGAPGGIPVSDPAPAPAAPAA